MRGSLQLTRVTMRAYAIAISYVTFLRAMLRILSHIALESATLSWGPPITGERGSAETDSRRCRTHGSSIGTTARNEGSRVIQAFAAPHANKNDAEMPKNSLADFVSATPSAGSTSDARSELVALMSWTVERMTATSPWPDIID